MSLAKMNIGLATQHYALKLVGCQFRLRAIESNLKERAKKVINSLESQRPLVWNKQTKKMSQQKKLAAILEGCRKGEEASQMALYRQFYSYGLGVCLRFAPSKEAAMEILNDGFFKVFKKVDQYNPAYDFKPWFKKILVNASIDHYRKYKRPYTEEPDLMTTESAAYNEALDQLEFDDLLRIMQSLPEAYRMAFSLYVIEGLTHKEIGIRLNISTGTSKSNLSKARQKIKNLLKKI